MNKRRIYLVGIILLINSFYTHAQKMKEYQIEIKLTTSKKKLWGIITNFKNYPLWNTILKMENNNQLEIGKKFKVSIIKSKQKKSTFKAKALTKSDNEQFSARQKIVGKWFFSATHFFIIKELNKDQVMFTQKWELTGLVASLFKKQIYKELALFHQMNTDLKNHLTP